MLNVKLPDKLLICIEDIVNGQFCVVLHVNDTLFDVWLPLCLRFFDFSDKSFEKMYSVTLACWLQDMRVGAIVCCFMCRNYLYISLK